MDEDFKEMLKYIRITGLISKWDEYSKLAQKKNYSNIKFLKHIIKEEYNLKKENSKKLRIQRAKIDEMRVIETFPFSNQSKFKPKKLMNIYDSFDYIKNNQNIIWIGPTGCGKTGLATSFLIHAINNGYVGRFIRFPDLVTILNQSQADHSQDAVIKKFAGYDVLLIDELGYVDIDASQVGLFFSLMSKRHHNRPTLVTSNLGFSEWLTFLKNEQLTAALIDRLTENSYVFNMKGCVSLRPKIQ